MYHMNKPSSLLVQWCTTIVNIRTPCSALWSNVFNVAVLELVYMLYERVRSR